MDTQTITCPYCGGSIAKDTAICPDCHENLSALVRLQHEHIIHYNQALSLARDGRLDAARDQAIAAVVHDPSFLNGHLLLAKICAASGDWPEAQARVARALELAPKNEQAKKLAVEIVRNHQRVGGAVVRTVVRNAPSIEPVAPEAAQPTSTPQPVGPALGEVHSKAHQLGMALTAAAALMMDMLREEE